MVTGCINDLGLKAHHTDYLGRTCIEQAQMDNPNKEFANWAVQALRANAASAAAAEGTDFLVHDA